jgi:hypothetical protein
VDNPESSLRLSTSAVSRSFVERTRRSLVNVNSAVPFFKLGLALVGI